MSNIHHLVPRAAKQMRDEISSLRILPESQREKIEDKVPAQFLKMINVIVIKIIRRKKKTRKGKSSSNEERNPSWRIMPFNKSRKFASTFLTSFAV